MVSNEALLMALGAAAVQARQTLDLPTLPTCPDGWSLNGGNNGNTAYYCCPGAGYVSGSFQGCNFGSTTVAYDDPNYTSIVSSLSAATNVDATPTESSSEEEASWTLASGSEAYSESSSSTTGAASSGSSGSAGAQQTGVSSTSQAGAQAMVTAAPLLGAAAFALLAL